MLAVDQTYEDKDQKSVLARTATLELSPEQTELVSRAQASGSIALSLRSLEEGESVGPNAIADAAQVHAHGDEGQVAIIRYGVERPVAYGQKE